MCPGIGLSLYGFKREMWNVGCIFIDGGRLRLYARSPTRLLIVKGPNRKQSNFLEVLVVFVFRFCNHILSPGFGLGSRNRFLFACSACVSCAYRISFRSVSCNSARYFTYS